MSFIAKALVTASLVLTLSHNSMATSIEKAIYTSGMVAIDYSEAVCPDSQKIKIEKCQSGYPLSCEAKLETTNQQNCLAPKRKNLMLNLPVSHKDETFLLKLRDSEGKKFPIIISNLIRRNGVIANVSISPDYDGNNKLAGFRLEAKVEVGKNDCLAQEVKAILETTYNNNLLVISAKRQYLEIKDRMLCTLEYSPIYTTIKKTIIFADKHKPESIIVKNLLRKGKEAKINIEDFVDDDQSPNLGS